MQRGGLYYPKPRPYNPALGGGRGKSPKIFFPQNQPRTIQKKPTLKGKGKNSSVNGNKGKDKKKRKRNFVIPSSSVVSLSDPRSSATTAGIDRSLTMANSLPDLAFNVNVSTQVFYSFPMAVVSFALQRGWQPGAGNSSYPFLAFGYMVNIMQNFAAGITPNTLDAPRCIAYVLQSIIPKTANFRGAKACYKFNFATSVPTFTQPIGPGGIASWTTGIPDPVDMINDLWLQVDAPTGYTLSGGEAAWQSLAQFMVSRKLKNTSMVSCIKANAMTKDISCYAVVAPNPGGGAFGVGGTGTTVSCEVSVRRPIFSCFYNNPTSQPDLTRYPVKLEQFGGDGIFLGAIASLYDLSWLKDTVPPRFKFCDLNEFIDVYATVLIKAVTQAVLDPTTQTALQQKAPADAESWLSSNFTCPISFQMFKLLMRALLMNIFSDTQCYVQGIFPRSTISDANPFTACTSSANTCPLPNTTYMLWPGALIENARSFTYNINEGVPKNVEVTVPVLGIYSQDNLIPTDYQITADISNFVYTFPLFQVIPGETNISLIDGSASGTLCFINDPAQLTNLASVFNDWVNNLSAYIHRLGPVSTDSGLNVLTMANVTAYWLPVEPTPDELKRRAYYKKIQHKRRLSADQIGKGKEMDFKSEEKPDFKLNVFERCYGFKPNRALLSTSPYASRNLVAYSFRFAPFKTVWEGIQQYMIMPIYNGSPGVGQTDGTNINRIAAMQGEGNQLIVANTSNVMSMASKHDLYASLMVQARNSPQKNIMDQIDELNKHGRGSIFSDIVNACGQAAVATGQVMSVAKGVLPLIPF
jgi:hypothetical protein